MMKFGSIALFGALGLISSGCFLIPGMGGGTDMAKSMSETGQAQATIQLHDDPQVGQYFEYEMTGGTKQWWGVTGMKDGKYVVEMRMKMGAGWVTQAYICEADGTVTDAYVANWDADAEELSEGHEMKVADPIEPGEAGEVPESTSGDETIEAGGKEWDCTWTQTGKSKVWMSDDAWFGKLIKSEYDGNVNMLLSDQGTDATLGLKWPGEGDDEGDESGE